MIRKLSSGEYRLYSRRKDRNTGRRRIIGTFPSLEEARSQRQAQERAHWRFWKVVEAAIAGMLTLLILSFAVWMLVRPGLLAGSPEVLEDPAPRAGFAWLPGGLAIFSAALLGYYASHGYVYCGWTETVSRQTEPRLFWLWFSVHVGLVLGMATLALAFIRAF